MGNWSRVMIVWSGIDGKVREKHGKRLRQVLARADREPHYCKVHLASVVYPCGHDAGVDMACEFVAVGSSNHFHSEALVPALAEFEWQYPEQVGVLWKGEEDDEYYSVYLPEASEQKC